jgi:Zn-finger nucleic acid-binding protein
MMCPHCHTELKIADRQGIEIDYCPKCRGVWLDRGELDKILERSQAMAPAPGGYQQPAPGGYPQPGPGAYQHAPQGYRRHDDDDDDDDDRRRYNQGGYGQPGYGQPGYDPRYQRRRKEHWLSDLFDFG